MVVALLRAEREFDWRGERDGCVGRRQWRGLRQWGGGEGRVAERVHDLLVQLELVLVLVRCDERAHLLVDPLADAAAQRVAREERVLAVVRARVVQLALEREQHGAHREVRVEVREQRGADARLERLDGAGERLLREQRERHAHAAAALRSAGRRRERCYGRGHR